METQEMMVLVLLLGLAVSVTFADTIEEINRFFSELPDKLLAIATSPIFIISIVVLCLIGLAFLVISKQRRLKQIRIAEEERIERGEVLEEKILKLLGRKTDSMNSKELEYLIERLESYNKDSRIKDRIKVLKTRLREVERDEYERSEEGERDRLREEIKELRKQRYLEELRREDNRQRILDKFEEDDRLFFELDKLKKKEIDVLKDEFDKVNEYDPVSKSYKDFLVRRILNHTPTHTFLVGRIKELIEKYANTKRIKTHNTKDADITFEIKYKIYAFEIETGSLLSKKRQLHDKVSSLNNKYGQNWYFVVSNRDLAKKYRKYGKVTSRMGVRKIIKKLAEN